MKKYNYVIYVNTVMAGTETITQHHLTPFPEESKDAQPTTSLPKRQLRMLLVLPP